MSQHSVDWHGEGRGLNTAVGYVLALGITTILISLLLLSASGFVESHQRSVVTTEMEIVGQTVAAHAMDADRVIQKSDNPTVHRTVDLPDKLGGAEYTLEISPLDESETAYDNTGDDETLYEIRLRTTNPVAEDTVRFRSESNVRDPNGNEPVVVNGGNLEIRYENGNMVITHA